MPRGWRPAGPPCGAGGGGARRTAVLSGGMAPIADVAMSRYFSPKLLASEPPAVATARRTLLATVPEGYAGCCAAIRDHDMSRELAAIQVPSLVICGDLDVSMPWTGHSDLLATHIPGARVV